jgi:manganese transport protein
MAGSSIFAGIFLEPYDMKDIHSKIGTVITLGGGLVVIFFLADPFQGLIWSQIGLSIQLPWTIFALIALTSSQRVMGKFASPPSHRSSLWIIAAVVTALNVLLLVQMLR